jgi:hypothetical protein
MIPVVKAQETAMTPEERNLITELFDRLATLEDAARDPEAERAIKEGLRQAPNAAYALVQTTLVQDEALKRADARIRELEAELGIGAEPARPAGFLDNMRDSLFGRREAPPRAGSVPSVRPGEAPMGAPEAYRSGMGPSGMGPGPGGMGPGPGSMMEPPRPGGSFLGTAAAAAAGVIGGSMMLDGIRSMMGHHGSGGGLSPGAAHAAGSPWSSGAGGGDLGRQAGLDDIGRSPSGGGESGSGHGAGLFDSPEKEAEELDEGGGYDAGFDGGDGGGDGD